MNRVTQEPCPECRSKGRDTKGDNLHRWEDGHAHCFACGLHISAIGIRSVQGYVERDQGVMGVYLPRDATNVIDKEALQWLSKYDITNQEVMENDMLWSPSKQQLIYPIYSEGEEGKLIAWQGRNFSTTAHYRYQNMGPFHTLLHHYNLVDGRGDNLIIVEDVVSAIKVARKFSSLCLFGNHLNNGQIIDLRQIADRLIFWLDEDKADKAFKLAKEATQYGLQSSVIITKHDPKDYNDQEIAAAIGT